MSQTTELSTVTVGLVRSFQHRTVKHLVLKDINVNDNTDVFMSNLKTKLLKETSIPPPFRNFSYNTLKIEHQAHGAKTNDPLINRGDDSLILNPTLSLAENGVKNETVLLCFKKEDYDNYKKDPTLIW